MIQKSSLRPWARSRIVILLIAPFAIVINVVAGAFYGGYEGFCGSFEEMKSAWRVIGQKE